MDIPRFTRDQNYTITDLNFQTDYVISITGHLTVENSTYVAEEERQLCTTSMLVGIKKVQSFTSCKLFKLFVCLFVVSPPLPRDGGTARTAIEVHAVNLIEISPFRTSLQ